MIEIFITPGSVILGVTLYKPYFIRKKCKFLCILFGPGLNLYFEKFFTPSYVVLLPTQHSLGGKFFLKKFRDVIFMTRT